MISIIWFLIVGIVAGLLAARVTKIEKPWYVTMLIGMVGAVVGGLLALVVEVRNIPLLGELVTATLGAILCLWIWDIYSRRRSR